MQSSAQALSDNEIRPSRSAPGSSGWMTIRRIEIAKVGHYSSVFSCTEIFSALFYRVMHLRRCEPGWQQRDCYLIGKGHAAVELFPVLTDLDFFGSSLLDGYTRLGGPLGDHPGMTKVPGVDFSSGSIGHALSIGAGMALVAHMKEQDFRVFVMLGYGEMQGGQVWEAALFASHHRLDRLVAIVDRNGYQLDGKVDDVMGIELLKDKWQSFGWHVHEVDGHDIHALTELLRKAVVHALGHDLNIIACGLAVFGALQAAEELRQEGHSVGVIDMATIKPLDRQAVLQAAASAPRMMTVEEHNVLGGLGAAVADVLADEGAGVRLYRHGIHDENGLIAPLATLYPHYKLDGAGIAEVARVQRRRG